jgi:ABC-type Na+ efflux pump permease subunit
MPALSEPVAPRAATIRHRAFSVSRIWALATNTFTELVRLKIFYFLLIFALLLIGSSVFLIRLSFQDQFQMLKDVSLGSMSIFTSLLAILATAGLLPKDIEDRTLYTILAKPVPRFEYLLGKLLGVILLLLVAMLLMGALFALVLVARVHVVTGEILSGSGTSRDLIDQQISQLHATAYNPNLWAGGLVIFAKACLLASLTLFISTFASSSIFTIIVSVVIYFIGHLQATARDYWQVPNALHQTAWWTKAFLAAISLVFPDLQLFNLVDEIVVGTSIAPWLLFKTLGLGATYCVIYLLAAYFVFASREV